MSPGRSGEFHPVVQVSFTGSSRCDSRSCPGGFHPVVQVSFTGSSRCDSHGRPVESHLATVIALVALNVGVFWQLNVVLSLFVKDEIQLMTCCWLLYCDDRLSM